VKMVTTQLITTEMDSDAVQEESTIPKPTTLVEALQEGATETSEAGKSGDADAESEDEYADMPDLGDIDADDDDEPPDEPRNSRRSEA